MFKNCLIKQVLKQAHYKKVSLEVVQRYLFLRYKINTSMFALRKRKTMMTIMNQL
tara:strand:+ start:915 stop:1079 length:165 start_codon:yes stop_codon:yes gene_type:complete